MSPERQDRAALELMRRRGVTANTGISPELAAKLAPEWASFQCLMAKAVTVSSKIQQLERFFNNALAEEQFGTL